MDTSKLQFTRAETKKDIEGILQLQQNNLTQKLPDDEIKSQGFVTVTHTIDLLDKLNKIEKHIIVKENERVIGYLLAMTQASSNMLPILRPMFEQFATISYKGKKVTKYNFVVVGQVCIDKFYRGQGILDRCYEYYKNCFMDKYDFAITEIAISNQRSVNAHKRIGFKDINSYKSNDNIDWTIVLWDWKNGS